MLTAGSLFSGIGGFDLGFERAGMRVVWQCEIDRDARRVLRRRWPDATLYGDAAELRGTDLPAVDVLCGGFPCQDLSVAGRRAGLAGERSGLFYQFARLIAECRPSWVVIENVPGLLSSQQGRDMGIVLGTLGELGYWWAYRVLDAQYHGVAQRRRRVFIVGHAGEPTYPASVLFESQSCSWDSPPSRQARQGVAGSLGGGSGSRGWAPDTERMTFLPATSPTLTSSADNGYDSDGTGHGTPIITDEVSYALSAQAAMDRPERGTVSLVAHALKAEGADGSEDGTGRGVPIVIQDTNGVVKDQNGAGVSEGEVAYTLDGRQHQGVAFRRATRPHGAHYTDLDDERWEEADRADGLTPPSATQNMAVAFHMTQDPISEEDFTPAWGAGNKQGTASIAVAFTERTRADGRNFEAVEEVAYALTNPGSGGRAHSRQIAQGMAVRRLTPVECERLQGFPDGWTEALSDSARYRCLGNAVCVPVSEWVGRRLVEVDGCRS